MMPSDNRHCTAPRDRAGFSLLELLIATIMVIGIAGAGYALFRSQARAFRDNSDRYDLTQNARGTLEGTERVIRTMGAGTPAEQPVLVYGSTTVLAFNSDFVESDTVDLRWAAYFNPDVPSGESEAWEQASATAIPNSSPSYSYPAATYRLGNGSLSPAETYIFYFENDPTTARGDDYALWQRANNGVPQIVARNILPHPNGRPFFEYLIERGLSTGDTLMTAPSALLPLIRRPLVGGISSADSANYVRPDSVRAIRLHLRLTNGRSGTEERMRDISTTIEVPNNGIPLPNVCGRSPYAPGALATVDTALGSGRVWLTWPASADQAGGEQDVRQYIIWRRPAASAVWAEPLVVVRAETGVTSYTTEISGNEPGTAYMFAVAAQDCTPAQSTLTTASLTTSVAP
jgi:type II secretory pathway pseudopilin PulG